MIIRIDDKLRLRSFEEADYKSYYEIAHEKAVRKYLVGAYVKTMDDAKDIVKIFSNGDLKNDFYLLVELNEIPIGAISAVRTVESSLEVSAFLSTEYRCQGIMTASMDAFIEYLENYTSYEVLYFTVKKKNLVSNRQIQKLKVNLLTEYPEYYIYARYLNTQKTEN